jgi:hypothetical protein
MDGKVAGGKQKERWIALSHSVDRLLGEQHSLHLKNIPF